MSAYAADGGGPAPPGPTDVRRPQAGASEETVCIDNIGPRGRRRRFFGGVLGYVVTAGAVGWLASQGLTGPVWLLLFVPLMSAGVGVFQALEKT
jgi:hypothetical protein